METADAGSPTPHVLRAGLIPYLSPGALIKTWSPFVTRLEHYLQQPIMMKSAPNFPTFIQRASAGRYDLLMVAPHIGILAKRRAHYRIAVGFGNPAVGEVLVRADSPYRQLESLRGLELSAPANTTLVSIMGEALLQQQGLDPQRDVRMHYTGSHNNAILALQSGKVDAAIVISGLYARMAATLPVKLRSLAVTAPVLPAIILTHPALSQAEHQRIQQALLATAKDPMLGEYFLQQGFGVPRLLTPAEIQAFDPLVDLLLARENR